MELNEIFGPTGLLAIKFPDYEQREGQVRMANLVNTALNNGSSAVIEGATGIGKSFAYLIPLILSGKKFIVSTSNKSLQDQLSNKDLPSLKEMLGVEFDWAVLKGKNNYFCHEHFQANQKEIIRYLMSENMSEVEAKLKLKEIVKWADETKDGDVEYYPDDLPKKVKELITCDTNTVHDKDSVYFDLCFVNRARAKAKEARIVLVNHTLVALDISLRKETDGKVTLLPEDEVIVIDEAHTFEKYSVMAFSDEISFYSLNHLINWYVVKSYVKSYYLSELVKSFLKTLNKYLPEKGETGYYIQKKFDKFDGFEETLELLDGFINQLKIAKVKEKDKEKVGEVIKEANNLIKRIEKLSDNDENILRWSEARDSKLIDQPIIKLKSVPIDISELLKDGLFNGRLVICTSATLAVNGNFDLFRYQIGVPEDALELIVETPFDFKTNALVYISNGEHEKAYEIEKILSYSKGRAFILFTSYKDMKYFYDLVDTPYPKLIQGDGLSRTVLLEQFKNTKNAILFATRSFWEGIDVKGDDLITVIIHKIPFENPRDLIYTSKIDKIDNEFGKGKHWGKFTIPDACLKLKQGVGRLIRSKTDIGVIALLDARVNFRNYGNAVINSLPPAYKTQKLEKVQSFFERWNR